jgi:hypothetical protein
VGENGMSPAYERLLGRVEALESGHRKLEKVHLDVRRPAAPEPEPPKKGPAKRR